MKNKNDMNDLFNLKRFGAYAARDYRANWKKYAIMAATLLGALLLELLFLKITRGKYLNSNDIQEMWGLNFGFLIVACIEVFTISVMKPMKSRHTLAVENTIPASGTERYLFILLNTTVVFFAVYLLTIFMIAALGIATLGVGTLGDYLYNDDNLIIKLFLWLWLPLQAIVMYAGTMERRRHIVSMLLVAVTVVAGVVFFGGFPELINQRFHTDISFGPLFLGNTGTVNVENTQVTYGLSDILRTIYNINGEKLATGLAAVVTLVFWVAAWFNFRERSAK